MSPPASIAEQLRAAAQLVHSGRFLQAEAHALQVLNAPAAQRAGALRARPFGGLRASPSATSAKPGATIPSLTLLVRILPNEIVPLHLQVMKRPAAPIDAKSLGAPVLLNSDGWTRRPPGTSELQIGVHSRTGALLAVHGWPARAVRFNDRATATPDVMLEGDVVASLIADRTLTFPLRRDASVAVLYRLTVARPHLAGSDQQPVFPSMSVVEPTPKRLVGEGPYGRVELEVLPLAAFLLSGLPDHPAAPAKEGTKLDPLWDAGLRVSGCRGRPCAPA